MLVIGENPVSKIKKKSNSKASKELKLIVRQTKMA
jgi:hypothetical protein